MGCRAFVFQSRPGDHYRVGRTLRSLHAAGIPVEAIGPLDASGFQRVLELSEPVLLVRAGAWLANPGTLALPAPSATGRGTCTFGCLRPLASALPTVHPALEAWRKLFAATGGDFNRARGFAQEFPDWITVHLDVPAVLASRRLAQPSLGAWVNDLPDAGLRVVHYPPLDVFDDEGLRVHQIITALHRGGAERLTLDLFEVLPEMNVACRLTTLGKALRTAFPTPLDTLELGLLPGSAEDRWNRLKKQTLQFGTDVLHAHLLSREQLHGLARVGPPILATLHNAQPGWPPGMAELQATDVALLAACSQAVEAEARALDLAPPIRTAWNGIRTDLFRRTPHRAIAAQRLREVWGFSPDDLVLLSLANFRPQKRLHLLPAIVEALRTIITSSAKTQRMVRLVFAGESLRDDSETRALEQSLRDGFHQRGLDASVLWLGSTVDVPAVLAASDVLISTGAHEGLSLAHLEALSMGCPVVATRVGGAPEVAAQQTGLHLVPADASPETFADTVLAALGWSNRHSGHEPRGVTSSSTRFDRPPRPWIQDPILPSFTTERMAHRYRWLYRRAIANAAQLGKPSGEGLWLISNNFSTGGAQSSARRLLLALKRRGMRVGAAVVQESPLHPTPGRRALQDAGIPVIAIPPIAETDPALALEPLLEAMDQDPASTVFFWNLIPLHKVLLADALCQARVYDISPGEMFFESLHRYFNDPRPGLPYRSTLDYGSRLAGCVVKYAAEADRARAALGAPVQVIPNGVAPDDYPLARMLDAAPGSRPLTLGTVARLNPHKRLEDLLAALRIASPQLPPWRLRIAGGMEPGFESYAAQLQASANDLPIEWLGDVADVRPVLQELDLFLMISEPAGCPNAILEAMATGLPVLATAVGGATDLLEHGTSGWLVPPRHAASLAEAILQLAADPARRRELGRAARDRILHTFSLDRMTDHYEQLILGPHAPSLQKGGLAQPSAPHRTGPT